MFQLFFAAVAVVAASIHLASSSSSRRNRSAIARTYLLYLLVIYVGVMGIFTAYAHVFRPNSDIGVHRMVTQPLRVRGWNG